MKDKKETAVSTADFINEYNKQFDSSILPSRFAKDYHIINCIKDTPDRSVYLLADSNANRFILKTGKNKRAEALWQEFHLYERLKNLPGLAIPECITCIETDNGCFLMTSYIKGLNLVQYQEKYAPLSEPDVVSLLFKMCHLINILHSQNPPIIHRDIKAENFILEDGTGVLYLVDLDTGRQFTPKKERDTMFVGTFSQAAPEQFGFSQSDIRTDIYGLGKSMLYLLTGDASTENLQEYGISAELRKILSKSTEFDPDKRYANVGEMIHDLKRYQLRHVTLPPYRMAAGIGILCLLAGVGIGYGIRKTFTEKIFEKNVVLNTESNSDSPAKNEQSGNDSSSIGENTYVSLRDQAGVYDFNPSLYREYYDALILDYYASDGDALVRDCEAFVTALQQDKEINRIPGQDYSKLEIDESSDFWGMDTLNSIRARLAYKDQMPYRQLGNYEKYKPYLFSTFGNYLGNGGGESFLASYARGEQYMGADEYTTYSCCLHDCLICIDDAFEQYYNFHGEE